MVEPGAAELAASGALDDEPTPTGCGRARRGDRLRAGDRRVGDSRFHILIGELRGSASVAAAVADVQGRLDGLLAAIPVFARNIAHSDAQHARIARAILRGRRADGAAVMAEHVEATAPCCAAC